MYYKSETVKITTIVRTLNEERNIANFLKGYSFSDQIIISDGGSTDRTYNIAWKLGLEMYKETPIIWHDVKELKLPDGFTHEPKHINSVIKDARETNPDWIIYDDCDCYPNKTLKDSARQWFEYAEKEGYSQIHLYRLYVYKGRWYFPDMNNPGQSLWAWKPGIGVSCDESGNPREQNMRIPESKTLKLGYPYCVIHNFAQSEKHIRQKMEFYEKVKGQPQLHPKQGCGRLAILPEAYK